jgi:shikimate kinase
MELIFFIGFMGCGKTTWSRKLAAHMGYDFIDLDHLLEEQAGMTIAEYFSTHGEDSFLLTKYRSIHGRRFALLF